MRSRLYIIDSTFKMKDKQFKGYQQISNGTLSELVWKINDTKQLEYTFVYPEALQREVIGHYNLLGYSSTNASVNSCFSWHLANK
jgi:hypothetical protein